MPTLLSLALLTACKDAPDDTASAWAPEAYCPGSPDCTDADGPLLAGAAVQSILPTCYESWVDLDADAELDEDESTLDCGCDRLCPEDAGYPGPDEGEGDGEFQAVWMAGFQNNRPAAGAWDTLSARALVLSQGSTRVGIVTLDLIGFFHADVLAIREEAAARGLDLDHVLVVSTHQHEGPDTMGLWGRTESKSGVDPDYLDYVVQQSAQALEDATADLREVGELRVGGVDASTYAEIGILNVLQDPRDPKIVDTRLGAALLRDTAGQTIATLCHFGNHPEATADENAYMTADYVHTLRLGLEEGLPFSADARPGYGGVSLFITGSLGGMMTPLGITITDPDGNARRDYSQERTYSLGYIKAGMAMDAIESGELVEDPSIGFARMDLFLPVDNWAFQTGFLSGILARETYNWNTDEPIEEGNIPDIRTELNDLWLGPIRMLTMPGELLPELAVGGYDGSKVGTTYDEIVDSDNPNPPDLSLAPAGPYLKDYLPTEHAWIVNLGNDELGYIVPPYNFVVDEENPWFDEPEGDHYEETNSLGPRTAPLLDEAARELTAWVNAR